MALPHKLWNRPGKLNCQTSKPWRKNTRLWNLLQNVRFCFKIPHFIQNVTNIRKSDVNNIFIPKTLSYMHVTAVIPVVWPLAAILLDKALSRVLLGESHVHLLTHIPGCLRLGSKSQFCNSHQGECTRRFLNYLVRPVSNLILMMNDSFLLTHLPPAPVKPNFAFPCVCRLMRLNRRCKTSYWRGWYMHYSSSAWTFDCYHVSPSKISINS